MRICLPLLCVLCAAQAYSTLDGTCMRKDPPPGVLVLHTGSKLVLTCRGHVMVNGVKVNITRNRSDTKRRVSPSVTPTTAGSNLNSKYTMNNIVNAVSDSDVRLSTVTGENGIRKYTDAVSTTSPTTHPVHPTNVSRLQKSVSDWEGYETNEEGDYDEDEEEGDEGTRVTRGITSSPQWKFDGKFVGKGKRDWGDITFERATLTLSSVRLKDSGNYTCHHRGRERFSIKVIIEDPPEKPTLSCFKRSPSSKIRCESEPRKPFSRLPSCYLILNKNSLKTFQRLQCSYSSRLSRYWYALDFDDDELRTPHVASLCLTSITGNITSSQLFFTPLNILKPYPPSGVKVQQLEGHMRRIRVTWNSPLSWKSQDNYFKLIFELKYKPAQSSFSSEQIKRSTLYSDTITDLLPGTEYLIQVRAKEQYDGLWSDWSTPVSGMSWTAPEPTDAYITTFLLPTEEGSAFIPEGTESALEPEPVLYHILWIPGSFLLFSVIFAIYILRHRDRFMPKFHHLSVVTQFSDSSQPPAHDPTVLAGQTLVTFAPPRYKEPPLGEAREMEGVNEQEQTATEMTKAMHFNNTSYFLLQPK